MRCILNTTKVLILGAVSIVVFGVYMFDQSLSTPRFSQMIEYLTNCGYAASRKPRVENHYAELDDTLIGFIRQKNKTFQELVTLMQDACTPFIGERLAPECLVDRRLQVLRRKNLISVVRKGNAFLWNVN